MDTFIAADIGGTQIRVAVYPVGETRPLIQKRISTRAKNEPALDRLINLIAELWPVNTNVRAISIAAPGFLDPESGTVITAPNIPGWQNLPLRQILRQRFHVPVLLGNDANLAALGEWRFGAGRGHHNLLYLTISTGIGGSVIANDQLIQGCHGLATEFGHITVLPDGPICSCGHRGHLEAVASGLSIARWTAEQIAFGRTSSLPSSQPLNARDISQAAAAGDPLSVEALARAGEALGKALADFLHIFNPSIVILGGGVSHSGPLLISPLCRALEETVISKEYLHELVITRAELGDDCGLLGALALAMSVPH